MKDSCIFPGKDFFYLRMILKYKVVQELQQEETTPNTPTFFISCY